MPSCLESRPTARSGRRRGDPPGLVFFQDVAGHDEFDCLGVGGRRRNKGIINLHPMRRKWKLLQAIRSFFLRTGPFGAESLNLLDLENDMLKKLLIGSLIVAAISVPPLVDSKGGPETSRWLKSGIARSANSSTYPFE